MWIGVASLIGLAVFLGAIDLFAKPRLPIAGAPPPSLLAATSSPEAHIAWAPARRVRITLSPGENASSDVTFTSTRALTNVSLRLATGTDEDGDDRGDDDGDAGSIAPFLTFQPTSFATVPAGQAQTVHLSLTVPAGTALGKYKGWIRVRVGNQKLRKTLKVKLNVWQQFTSSYGFSIAYPPNWIPTTYENTVILSSTSTPRVAEGDPGNEVQVTALPAAGHSTVEDWLQSELGDVIDFNAHPPSHYTNPNGVVFAIVQSVPSLSSDNASGFTLQGNSVIQISVNPASQFVPVFQSVLASFRPM